MYELRDKVQQIFDSQEPRRFTNGQPIRIPFEMWSKQTQDYFLGLANVR